MKMVSWEMMLEYQMAQGKQVDIVIVPEDLHLATERRI